MKVLKIIGISLLSVVAAGAILLFCAVKFLGSKDFSDMAERMANEYLDGTLTVESLKLGFHPRFPILGVEVKNLTLISQALDSLPPAERQLLPNYTDSLLKLDYLAGALDIKKLLRKNELDLRDVVMRGLSVNLVIAHNGKGNFEIVKPQTDTVNHPKKKMPIFRINRFNLEQPKEIRFYNAADSTSASVLLLTDAAVDGEKQPTYRLKINGNITSPKATLITNLEQINFGLNGKVFWDPSVPAMVAVDEMELRGAFIKAVVAGEIDLKTDPVIRKLTADLHPMLITDLLTMLPDSLRQIHRLQEPYLSTDLSIGGKLELTQPMNLATDTFPAAKINLYIPPSTLSYGKAKFKDIELQADMTTLTNLPDSTVVDLSRCIVAGEDTRLEISAILSRLFSDPTFSTTLKGEFDLTNLPPSILEKIPGYLSGTVATDLKVAGTTSMFKPQHFQRLRADGSVTGRNLYFLSGDTGKMAQINKARIDLSSDAAQGEMASLRTKVSVDTANILIGGVDIACSSLTLGAGLESTAQLRDSTLLPDFGGDLNVAKLNIISITDSAGARIRDVSGHVTLHMPDLKKKTPEILADLLTGRVSAGSLSDRILLNDTKINATLLKLPQTAAKTAPTSRKARPKKYSHIPPREVFKYAYNKRRHKPGQKRTRRVYGTTGAGDNEILKWDLAKGFNKFLNEWKLKGSVLTHNARLLTPIFPLHNRFTCLSVKFTNDTVNLSDISFSVGKSDITLSGRVTNVKRALTAATHNTLKMDLTIQSDTIDINELSAGVFTGASYADARRHDKVKFVETDNDADLETRLEALAKAGPGKAAPVLIPVNVDANLRINGSKVLYSDLVMHNFGGDILVYDGAVNLHDMKADSDAGNLTLSALYSAPRQDDMQFGFGLDVKDFNIAKFLKLVPAIDSIMPLTHDFSGTIYADIAATCRIDSGMNINLPSLNAAIRINGDNLAFINPKTYRTIGKWLGFKDKADNTIHSMNVEMTVTDGLLRVYPFTFNIDRYRLGVYGSNDIAMNFDYHISVLKSPLPFKFGITISGNPEKYKVRFGGAKFKEDTAVESVNVVNNARINLIDQIEKVFKRGVQNSRFAKLELAPRNNSGAGSDPGLSAEDSLQLIREGLLEPTASMSKSASGKQKFKKSGKGKEQKPKKKRKKFFFF